MADDKSLEMAMQLIIYGGEGKACAFEAIAAAKAGKFEAAAAKIQQANQALLQAHHAQTEMLSKEADGQKTELSLLMVHGQDHLMTSIAFVDLAKEIVDLYKEIKK